MITILRNLYRVTRGSKDVTGNCTFGASVNGILKVTPRPTVSTVRYFKDEIATSQGLRFSEFNADLTKEWFMFTPLDISQDGEQTIPLIASGMYIVGEVKVLVKEGSVTVNYTLLPGVTLKSEFLTIFANLAAVTTIDPEELKDQAMTFGKPISIVTDLAGDTKILLYVRNVIDYNDSIVGLRRFSAGDKDYLALVETLKAIMD